MNITKNLDRCLQIKKHIFLFQDFGGLVNNKFDSFLVQFYWFSPLAATSHVYKLLDNQIENIFFFSICSRLNEVFILFKLICHFL